MAQFDKTFPTLDCSACILTPKMVTAGTHPNITLLTWSEVEKVDGYVGNFTVTIRKKARYVQDRAVHRLRHLPGEMPQEGHRRCLRGRVWAIARRSTRRSRRPCPKYPVIDVENCTYFQKGTCKACEKFCPTGAIDFKQEDEIMTVEVGNIILATGYDLFDARRIPQYGYGRLANVFTSLEFERLSNAAGPTNGKIVLRDGVTAPQSVGIVHCVGSRDRNYNNYCSAICCMQSLKFAHLVKERTGATVYNFYIDMRTPAKAYDEFYQRVLEEGTLFVRGKVAEVTDAARLPGEEGKLIIQVEDTLAGKQRRIPVDMVILSAGLEPRHDAKEVGKMFGISCSADGWFIEKHPKLDPVATMTEGIFIAGCVPGPEGYPGQRCRKARPPPPACWARSSRRRSPWSRCAPASIAEQVLRLPHLQQPVPVQRHPLPRGPAGHRDQPGAVPGLRHLRGRLPGRRHQRHGLQQRADPGADRGLLLLNLRQMAMA